MPHSRLLGSLIPVALFTWLQPRTASALLEECGSIDLNDDVECEVYVEGGCDVVCDPSKLELACSGELYASCRSERCDIDIDVDCNARCTVDCAAECELDPGNFSCEGRCEGSCEADCDAQCEASSDRRECAASCRATCSGECAASCEGERPELACEARCAASCEGQCRAAANIDCQIECQADGYLECKSNMADICQAQCKRPDGAILCDGQFVNAEDIDRCRRAIEAALDIEVKASGSADGDCSGNQCSAEAKGKVSCAVEAPSSRARSRWEVVALGVVSTLAMTRRRRRHA